MDTDLPTDSLFTEATFDELDIPAEVRRAIDELGFTRLTRVQKEVLPLTLAGRDVVVQAQTGTGKTATYLLTIFTHALRTERRGAIGCEVRITGPACADHDSSLLHSHDLICPLDRRKTVGDNKPATCLTSSCSGLVSSLSMDAS